MYVKTDIENWDDLRIHVWSGAQDVVQEIERQGREDDAWEYIQEAFDPDVWTPTITEINDYVWFDLPDEMNLYGDDEDEEEDDE